MPPSTTAISERLIFSPARFAFSAWPKPLRRRVRAAGVAAGGMRVVAPDGLFGLGAGLLGGVGDVHPTGDVNLACRGILAPLRRRQAELAIVERRLRRQRLDAGQGREHQPEA